MQSATPVAIPPPPPPDLETNKPGEVLNVEGSKAEDSVQ